MRSRKRQRATAGSLVLALVVGAGVVGAGVAVITASVAPGSAFAALPSVAEPFVANGPAPINNGVDTPQDAGAVQPIVVEPGHPNTVYVGAVNGGIWKTTDFQPDRPSHQPTWSPLTDHMPSLSIAALDLDPTDNTHRTLVAAIGRTSSDSQSGPLTGVLRTTDGGSTWAQLGTAQLAGEDLLGVAARGLAIVVVSESGFWRSGDGGVKFTRVSPDSCDGSTPPAPELFSLVGDPADPSRLFAAGVAGGTPGAPVVYRSGDTGQDWCPLDAAQFHSGPHGHDDATRMALAIGSYDGGARTIVYGAIVTKGGEVPTIFRSGDDGRSWQLYDTPSGVETFHQGKVALAADPTSSRTFYLAGDEGATDRCTVNPDQTLGACVETTNGGTLAHTAPHADSRQMVFDGADALLQSNDGGLYLRTNPRDEVAFLPFLDRGDWSSKNGNLAISEALSCAYDHLSNVSLCGLQDNGTVLQPASGSLQWNQLQDADGGVVSVSDRLSACPYPLSAINCSTRYYSQHELHDFTRATCTSSGVCFTRVGNATHPFPKMDDPGQDDDGHWLGCASPTDNSTCGDPGVASLTPLTADRVDPTRVVIATTNIWESKDSGATVHKLDGFRGKASHALAYGGTLHGIDDPGLLYVGGTAGLFVRSAGADLAQTAFDVASMGEPTHLSLDPDDWRSVFVTTSTYEVWHSPDAGATWRQLTDDLSVMEGAHKLRSIAVIPARGGSIIAVGADDGIYITDTHALGHWAKLSGALPNAVVFALDYNPDDDVLLAGTLGRSTWLLHHASTMALSPVLDAGLDPSGVDVDDLTTLQTRLTDGNSGAAIVAKKVHFVLGTQVCDATTDDSGLARCPLIITQHPADYTMTATFAGDAHYTSAYLNLPFTVIKEDTHLVYTGPENTDLRDPTVVSARLLDPNDATPIAHQRVAFQMGSSGADQCQAETDASGVAECPITPTRAETASIIISFAGTTDYDATTRTESLSINREDTAIAYTGATAADFHDPVLVVAVVTDPTDHAAVGTVPVRFTLGTDKGEGCWAVTGVDGQASCQINPSQPAGQSQLTATVDSADFASSSVTVPFTIRREETSLLYTGPPTIANATPTVFSASLSEDTTPGIGGRQVTITLQLGHTTQSCTAVTDESGSARCPMTPDVPANTRSGTATATFVGDPTYIPSSTSADLAPAS